MCKMIDDFLTFLSTHPYIQVTTPNQYGVKITINHPFRQMTTEVRTGANYFSFLHSFFGCFILLVIRKPDLKDILFQKLESAAKENNNELVTELTAVEELMDYIKKVGELLAAIDAYMTGLFEDRNPFPHTLRQHYNSITTEQGLNNWVKNIVQSNGL